MRGARGGTETNRARVNRRGAEQKRGEENERGCERDNDRVSERGSVNERPTERDESMWNTKADRHYHLSLSPSLPPTFFFSHISLHCSLLSFTFLKTICHCSFPSSPPVPPPLSSPRFLSPPSLHRFPFFFISMRIARPS